MDRLQDGFCLLLLFVCFLSAKICGQASFHVHGHVSGLVITAALQEGLPELRALASTPFYREGIRKGMPLAQGHKDGQWSSWDQPRCLGGE